MRSIAKQVFLYGVEWFVHGAYDIHNEEWSFYSIMLKDGTDVTDLLKQSVVEDVLDLVVRRCHFKQA